MYVTFCFNRRRQGCFRLRGFLPPGPDGVRLIKDYPSGLRIKKAFAYFDNQKISLENLVAELKEDFGQTKCLSVNSKEDSEEKQLIVNSLEDKDNEVRVVFAVDKLNEGWDVLNLFDIVRSYETRDSKGGRPGRTTVSEAQLIGRGARYFPFQLNGHGEKYKRKYDKELENEMRALEELYYHSSHNPRYIQELQQALIQTGIMPERAKEIQVKLKDNFKKTDFWKSGIIFLNNRIANDRADIFGFSDIKISQRHKYYLRTGYTEDSTVFNDTPRTASEKKSKIYKVSDFGQNLIRKALQKKQFYKFSNLKKYFPHLSSITEFITSPNYLGRLEVEVFGTSKQIQNLHLKAKLKIALSVLETIAKEIETGTAEYIGTKEFKPLAIAYCFKDKTLKIVLDEGSDKEYGRGMREARNYELQLDLSKKDWYVYDENYGTAEEKYFVKFINNAIDKLKENYSDIYLIRNERFFKIHQFSDGAPIEPDFVLFLKEKNSKKALVYQIFIEPKGEHLIANDQWKENFLKDIEAECKIEKIFQDRDYKLVGMPFYNEKLKKKEFEDKFKEVTNT